jgi:hypothetical protein
VLNSWIVILSEGVATDFDTALCACRAAHAACSPDIALQQEDERAPRKLPASVTSLPLADRHVAVPETAVPGIARMWRASDNFWK